MVLGGGQFHKQGTPVALGMFPVHPLSIREPVHATQGCLAGLLLTAEFIKEVSPLLPNPCHFQSYDQSMSQSGSRSCWGPFDRFGAVLPLYDPLLG